jgi:hypothetical protein
MVVCRLKDSEEKIDENWSETFLFQVNKATQARIENSIMP